MRFGGMWSTYELTESRAAWTMASDPFVKNWADLSHGGSVGPSKKGKFQLCNGQMFLTFGGSQVT